MTDIKTKMLATICIALMIVLIAVAAYFEVLVIGSLNSEIADRDSQIAQLTYLNSTLHAEVRDLNDALSDLNDIVRLYKSEVVYSTYWIVTYPPFQGLDLPAFFIDIDHTWIDDGYALSSRFNYAGYLIVQINSTSDSTYINYTCASRVGTFNLQRDIGITGATMFPVLPLSAIFSPYPAQGVFMTVSTHTAVPAKINITATYYY
jgi:hypothetical protein